MSNLCLTHLGDVPKCQQMLSVCPYIKLVSNAGRCPKCRHMLNVCPYVKLVSNAGKRCPKCRWMLSVCPYVKLVSNAARRCPKCRRMLNAWQHSAPCSPSFCPPPRKCRRARGFVSTACWLDGPNQRSVSFSFYFCTALQFKTHKRLNMNAF